ncbi:ATP-binding protein [Streptomyces bambusae]|uniref:ATP-binding protein n=1 Tax=Streptomyces bambusae TaxID=1550616 RepID=UPI001CFD68D0|nr:ATP-binding protein [Streptomyces bambusae]MCB5168476.1 ATP-binding protein [Streptomyces bambusae]
MNALAPTLAAPVRMFTQRFSPIRRGARLARHLAVLQLHDWGVPLDGEDSYAASVVIAELAANAITHGRVAGRDFELRMVLLPATRTLRVEVSDARGERMPEARGYGLTLVQAYARDWGVAGRRVGKTVWAELGVRAGAGLWAGPVTPGCR